MPGIELNLFYSLVPVTGVALLLRALIVGDYPTAGQFFLPVLVPTLVYAWIALAVGDRPVPARGGACSARPSGSTSVSGSGTWSATASRRRPADRPCSCFA